MGELLTVWHDEIIAFQYLQGKNYEKKFSRSEVLKIAYFIEDIFAI